MSYFQGKPFLKEEYDYTQSLWDNGGIGDSCTMIIYHDPWDEPASIRPPRCCGGQCFHMFLTSTNIIEETPSASMLVLSYLTSIILRGLTSLPRFGDTLAPGAFLSRTRRRCLGVSLRRSQELRAWQKWLDFPIATGSNWFYMLDFG